LTRVAMLLREFWTVGSCGLDEGEIGESDKDVGDSSVVDTRVASSSSWIAGVVAETEEAPMLGSVSFLGVWASERARPNFNLVSPLTENPMPDGPLPAAGELILKIPFILPWWWGGKDECPVERGKSEEVTESECL
jgi:hypothetical protein